MYLDEEIFNSEYNERTAKERTKNYMMLKNGYKETNDKHVNAVINKFAERSKIGFKKYGTNLERTDLTLLDWISHAQEEALDLALYLEVIKDKINQLT